MGKGRTALRFLEALKLYCALADLDPYAYSIFMFDSFEGMPEKQSFRDDHPGFTTGMLSHSIEEIRALLSREIDLGRGNVRLIKGFFAMASCRGYASPIPIVPGPRARSSARPPTPGSGPGCAMAPTRACTRPPARFR